MSADQRHLRAWLTLDEAAHDLTRRTGQRIGWPELLQLALDGHVALCVLLPQVEVHAPGVDHMGVTVPGSRPRSIEGLWDLPAEGLARQHLYQLVRDNGGVVGPAMQETRTGLVVERGTTRWELPQRAWPDHVATGRALAVRWEVLDALVGTQNGLDARALSPTPPVPAYEAWAQTAPGRQARITAFLRALKVSGALEGLVRNHPKAGERPLQAGEKLIWETAGYINRTTLFAWKSCRTGKQRLAAAQNFLEVLRMTPVQFIAKWKER